MGRSLCEDGMQRLDRAVDVEQLVLDEQDEIDDVANATARTIDIRAREGVHLLSSVPVDVDELDGPSADAGEAVGWQA